MYQQFHLASLCIMHVFSCMYMYMCVYVSVSMYVRQVSRESVQLHGRVAELEGELREVRREVEKERLRLAEEKEVAISDMQRQFSSTATER